MYQFHISNTNIVNGLHNGMNIVTYQLVYAVTIGIDVYFIRFIFFRLVVQGIVSKKSGVGETQIPFAIYPSNAEEKNSHFTTFLFLKVAKAPGGRFPQFISFHQQKSNFKKQNQELGFNVKRQFTYVPIATLKALARVQNSQQVARISYQRIKELSSLV